MMECFVLFSKMAASLAVVVAMWVGCALVVLAAVNDDEVWKIPVVIILCAAIIFGLWS